MVGAYGWQPQPAPQPPARGAGIAGADDAPLAPAPTEAKTESSRVEERWPSGHAAGALASDIGRRTSKTASQSRHLYS